MRIEMKVSLAVTVLISLFAVGARAQSTTDTVCTANGQQINCTSTTTDTGAQRAQTQQALSDAGASAGYALGAAIRAARLKHQAAKTRVVMAAAATPEEPSDIDKFKTISCAQTPSANTTNESSNVISCSDYLKKMRTFCTAAPRYPACAYLPVGEAKNASAPESPGQTAKNKAATSTPKDQ